MGTYNDLKVRQKLIDGIKEGIKEGKKKLIGKTCMCCGGLIYYTKFTGVTCYCGSVKPRNP